MITIVVKGLLLCLAYIYGAYTDIQLREIPDAVPLVIFLSGFINFSPLSAFMGFVFIGLTFLLAAVFGNMGGGDFKLMAASGFALGLSGGVLQTIIGLTTAITYVFLIRCIMKKTSSSTHIKKIGIPLALFLGAGGILSYLLINIL